MSLRLQAAADLGAIMADVSGGFGWLITVTDPTGFSAMVTGFSTDISESIDPETGMLVSGRKASVALPLAALSNAGLTGVPTARANAADKPWVIRFADILGAPHTFSVKSSNPDIAIGVVTCLLEIYRGPA